jgi:hypothetical protein
VRHTGDAMTEEHELVIHSSGQAGKYLARALATEGQRAAFVERKYVGGSRPNAACLPSKNVIHSAGVASYLRRGEEGGIAAGDRPVDVAAVRGRKRRMVDGLVATFGGSYLDDAQGPAQPAGALQRCPPESTLARSGSDTPKGFRGKQPCPELA